MQITVPQLGTSQQTVPGDSSTGNANPSLMLRDNGGNSAANQLTVSQLISTTIAPKLLTKTANFTAGDAADYLIDCTSGPVTVSFNPASSDQNKYTFMKKDSSGNAATISGVSGTTSLTTQYQKVTVTCDGTTRYSA